MRSYKVMIASSEITCILSCMKTGHMAEKFEVESVISLSPPFPSLGNKSGVKFQRCTWASM